MGPEAVAQCRNSAVWVANGGGGEAILGESEGERFLRAFLQVCRSENFKK